ncbi:bifunctional ADP-dependent NAD(P)H-hydrate dehydratase/NAD(P)H-hydrate epimerase [Aquimarina muelleri]|uniref:Bifunctional NAD(P)H-hydrate repair enzyme n=1 Tax=Aquimarina muelleri TaxID=279356 RepID=A0A918N2K3_9FLAO|nr:bifunctional ADP-dependent NAD(P)H-hydrate dehydratase/NAD(P)H-hydrate epimerase [Aquimarina muelleri]MCX2763030.1 bifunctional ADP-dependent NAD(P)H-hydrate dehydratase/NAD(P)H-hydrate epimerase [Aquimarina muelleri]GGX03327.1 bifunctional NAD(P)H-hydrate repair enzyme [Aquimarina muelleri]
MKIFSAQQMREADQATMNTEQITSLELMERAATQTFNLIHNRLQGSPILIHVFCGIGNNGGDGLVISRLLLEHGYNVKTYIVNFSDNRSKSFLINYDRLKEISKNWPIQLKSEADLPEINREDMIIDAIFGIGLNRPLVPWVILLIKHINKGRCFTLSIDIPSGLYTDKAPDDPEGVIYADITVTFQLPKLIFFLPQTGIYTRDLEVIDIGLDRSFLNQSPGIGILISKNEVLPLYRPRPKFSHKGVYGHCAIIGGSYGKTGSVVLATKAALRTGAGLVTAYIPECGYEVLQSTVPEAMVITDNDDELEDIKLDFKASAIGIGIGLGTSIKTTKAFEEFLSENKSPLLIDADGINILANNPKFLEKLPKNTILTPHPKELERLIGNWKDDFDKIEKTKAFSKTHNCIIVIKGANSITVFENQLYVNNNGNPGMATAGSGDVLTGMITGLLSQGYDPLHAAVFGVYLHGSAGDIAVQKTSFEGLIASEIVSHIGASFLELFKTSNVEEPIQQ